LGQGVFILLAFRQNRGLKGSLPISGDLDLHLSDTFHGEAAGIGAVAMIGFSLTARIPFPPQVEGQFPFHQDREGIPGHLSQVQAHHVKELFRGFANLLENIENFRYIDFQLHGVSPFWFVLANRQFKGNTPFFIPLKFHTIDFTLPAPREALHIHHNFQKTHLFISFLPPMHPEGVIPPQSHSPE
jgi:hypothetical protein